MNLQKQLQKGREIDLIINTWLSVDNRSLLEKEAHNAILEDLVVELDKVIKNI